MAFERSHTNTYETPLVSALVFTYGGERFMRGLLADLAEQTIALDLEIVIVDTGSPTGEASIVRSLIEAGKPNLVFLRTERRETAAAAANRCAKEARGEYLTLACVDDRHRPDALEVLVDELDRHRDVDLVYADSAVTEQENEDPVTSTAVVGYLEWPEFDPRLLWSHCYIGPQPVYRRSMHERFGYYDPTSLAADYDFYLRAVAKGSIFKHVPEVLGLYLRSGSGIEHSNPARMLDDSRLARIKNWPAEWGPCPT